MRASSRPKMRRAMTIDSIAVAELRGNCFIETTFLLSSLVYEPTFTSMLSSIFSLQRVSARGLGNFTLAVNVSFKAS